MKDAYRFRRKKDGREIDVPYDVAYEWYRNTPGNLEFIDDEIPEDRRSEFRNYQRSTEVQYLHKNK